MWNKACRGNKTAAPSVWSVIWQERAAGFGGPLRLYGKKSELAKPIYKKGLVLLSRTVLVYNVNADYQKFEAVLEKLDEEIAELRAELMVGYRDRLADEMGDLLFVVSNLARKLDLDPEACLRAANRKFARRFGSVEQRLAAAGKTPCDASLDEMETEWQAVKADE